MSAITFRFRAEVKPENQSLVLSRLRGLAGVKEVNALSPESRSSTVRRTAYAQLDAKADVEGVLQQVRAQPEVEFAEIPAERKLVM